MKMVLPKQTAQLASVDLFENGPNLKAARIDP